VAEVVLQRSRIDPLVRQLKAAGMAQHMRMDAKCHLGGLTEPFQHAAKADWAHGCPALAHEHVAPTARAASGVEPVALCR